MLSGGNPVTQTVKGRDMMCFNKMNGSSCKDLLTMGGPSTYDPERHFSRKPNNVGVEALRDSRLNIRSPDFKGRVSCDVTRDALLSCINITRN